MPYLILTDSTRAQGWAATREQADALIAERAPTAILPDCWTAFPVCRITLK